MAYQKLSEKKIIATNLNSYIKSQLTLISQARLRNDLEDEASFHKAVLEDNLNLEQQLDWRRDQLKRVAFGDKTEKRRIRGEMSTLKDLIEQKKFQDEYYSQVLSLNEGMQSIDTTLNWLNNKLSKTTDLNIQKSIKGNITKLTTLRYNQRKAAIQSQTAFANNDKTPEIVETQITRINNERAKSLKAGNEDYTALLDLQLQSLQKTLSESTISKTLLNFSVATMAGQSAISLLDQFNSEIKESSENTPITIGGIHYDSAKQFWELKRAGYLNDRTANGFFPRYQGELKEQVNYKASKGVLTNGSLADVKSFYDKIKDRPELADYQDHIAQDQQSSLQDASNIRSANILNEFAFKQDAKKAISDLAVLQDTYSVDQSLNYQKVVNSAAHEKEGQINQILSAMSSLMKANPGMSNQEALQESISSGAGAQYSPEELATGKASDIITGMGEKAKKQQFTEKGSKMNISPTEEGKTFASPQFKEGGLYKMPNDSAIYKYEGGSLRAFTGNWNEEQFKQATGKGFNSVETVKNISGVPQGDVIPAVENPIKKEQYGEKVFSPDLLKYYKPDQIISKGTDRYLKAGVKPVWGKKISRPEWEQLQQKYDPATLEKEKIVRAGNDIYFKQ